jgi:trigger factor
MKKNEQKLNKTEIPIELSSYKKIEVRRKNLEISQEEINKALDYLRQSRAKIITVNEPARKGNRVEIDFEVRHGGTRIEDGVSKNHPLILGEGRFLPGFEEKIEGMKAGEERNFSLKVPENWSDKRICDKNLDFTVKMNLVQEREIPDLDNEFAKSLGSFDSLDILRKNISEGLMEEKGIKERQRIRLELIEKVANDSKMEIPAELIEQELGAMEKELKFTVEGLGLDFEKYLNEIRKTREELKKDWQIQAEKRVKIGVCLRAIADKENINVSEEEINERINRDLGHHQNMEEADKNIDPRALREYTKEVLRNEKVFGLLEKEAQII